MVTGKDSLAVSAPSKQLVRTATKALADQAFVELFDSILEQSQISPETEAENQKVIADYILLAKTDQPSALAKRDRLAAFIGAWKGRIDFLLGEEERIASERHRIERLVAYFESSIHEQMKMWGVRRVNGLTHSYAVKTNPPSVEITNEAEIPDEYRHTAKVPPPDKRRIMDALADGIEVPGARIAETKTRIEVK